MKSRCAILSARPTGASPFHPSPLPHYRASRGSALDAPWAARLSSAVPKPSVFLGWRFVVRLLSGGDAANVTNAELALSETSAFFGAVVLQKGKGETFAR